MMQRGARSWMSLFRTAAAAACVGLGAVAAANADPPTFSSCRRETFLEKTGVLIGFS